MIIENFRMKEALRYADIGWPVFPCHGVKSSPAGNSCSCQSPCESPGKRPYAGTKGFHDATIDENIIREWWGRWPEANIGLATGAVSRSYVIDVDNKVIPQIGATGLHTLEEMERKYGKLPPTVRSRTGSGGIHLVFDRGDIEIRNSAKLIGPGIDSRGDGGYIIVPPSLHISGERYLWDEGRSPFDINPMGLPDWIIGILTERNQESPMPVIPKSQNEVCRGWVTKALAKAMVGNRNETGFWLACQLRDDGVSQLVAEQAMADYVSRVPQGGTPYGSREAIASLRQAYRIPPRLPAKSKDSLARSKWIAPPPREQITIISPPPMPMIESLSPTDELSLWREKIISGEVYNVPMSSPQLTEKTLCGLPGDMTALVGDPGSGKTMYILQQLQFWYGNDIKASAFFIEKDRKFHTMRLLAQLESNGFLMSFDWIMTHPDEDRICRERNREMLDAIGSRIYSAPLERVTLDSILLWMKERLDKGDRMLVVDPLTAVAVDADRWTKDDAFVLSAQHLLRQYGATLMLSTHAKKGNRKTAPTMDDMAGGAAYSRFVDSSMWINPCKKNPRQVRYLSTKYGIPEEGEVDLFMQINKARSSIGSGREIAFRFTEGLKFEELGMVTEDIKKKKEPSEE